MSAQTGSPTNTVGVLGFGEGGLNVSAGLSEAGAEVVAFDVRASELKDQAAEAGVVLLNDVRDLAARAGLILSLVTSSTSVAAARSMAPYLSRKHTYADMNTSPPSRKLEVEEIVTGSGASFADVAVMGSLLAERHRTPMFVSGPASRSVADALNAYGARLTVLDGPTGRAAALKLARSVFMKGLSALCTEALVFSEAQGVRSVVWESIGETMSEDFRTLSERLVRGTLKHSERRAVELRETAAEMRQAGLCPFITEAAERVLLAMDPVEARALSESPEWSDLARRLSMLSVAEDGRAGEHATG